MAKKDRKDRKVEEEEDIGLDLSTAAELWSEEELRQMIREETLKLLLERQGQAAQPNIQPFIHPYPPQTLPNSPQWTQTGGNLNHLNDGHAVNYSVNATMTMA